MLVENGNIEELAEKIAYLIENEKVRMDMGKQACMNVQRFQMENIVKQWKGLFEELTNNSQQPQN